MELLQSLHRDATLKFSGTCRSRGTVYPFPDYEWKDTILAFENIGLLVIDEIHEYRNIGYLWHALCDLRSRAWGVLGMSATPVVTSPMVGP